MVGRPVSPTLTEINPAQDHCQRWAARTPTWRHTSDGGFDADRYVVEQIDEAVAKAYIVANHYSGSYPASKYRFGLFDGPRLAGVLVFGIPASARVLTIPFPGLDPFIESVELSRLVLDDTVPANGESWFIARCFEEAAARGVRGVVSFADPVPRIVAGHIIHPGHVGIIYQATNAQLCGRSTARTLTLLPDGQVLNDRAAQKVRRQDRGHDYVERHLVQLGARPLRSGEVPAAWLSAALEDVGAVQLRHRGNWRYCFRIGTPAQRRRVHLALPAVPYPKTVD